MWRFSIKKDARGDYRAYFQYNQESIFWTEGYSSKAGVQNAIDALKMNAPGAPVNDQT